MFTQIVKSKKRWETNKKRQIYDYKIWSPFTFEHSNRGPVENYPVNWALIVPKVMSVIEIRMQTTEIIGKNRSFFSPVRTWLSFFILSFIHRFYALFYTYAQTTSSFSFIFTSVCIKNSWIDTNQISVGLHTKQSRQTNDRRKRSNLPTKENL